VVTDEMLIAPLQMRSGAQHIHGLRRTHATPLLAAGVDVKTVSERLGHDTV